MRLRHSLLLLVVGFSLAIPSTAAASAATDVWGWGGNAYSRLLGDGTTTDHPIPTAVPGEPLAWVSAGNTHSCGLNAQGEAFCWGRGGYGALGNGSSVDVATPRTQVLGGLTWASIAAAEDFTCGITTTGPAYCWGYNSSGQLGTGNSTHTNTPTLVAGGLTFSTIAGGLNFACGLTGAGEAYCWGDDSEGQLGNGAGGASTSPVAVSGNRTFTQLAVGGLFACGLTPVGDVYCWGQNNEAQLGDGTTTGRNIPVAVSGGLTFSSITTGGAHACGVTSAGVGYCWGSNGSGRLGIGSGVAYSGAPVAVAGSLQLASMTAGADHVCATTTAGVGYCWGLNSSGQLGDGSTTNRNTPTLVSGGRTFRTLVTGSRAKFTFGFPPAPAGATGSASVPTAALQQFVRPANGDCSAAPADFVDLPGLAASLRDVGWGQSWAQWPNDGKGGFVCSRQPYYTSRGTWSVL